MGKNSRKTMLVEEIDEETWRKIGTWLSDRLGEMEPDAASIREAEGGSFMPALRGLAKALSAGKPFRGGSAEAHRLVTVDGHRMRGRTVQLITEQLGRSRQKYPGNEHLLTAALESLGSLARALLCGAADAAPDMQVDGVPRVEKEAAQVCAILIRLIEEGDATFQGWPRQPRR